MKRLHLFFLALLPLVIALLLSACQFPAGLLSPSVSSSSTSPTDNAISKTYDYTGLFAEITKIQSNPSPFAQRYYMKSQVGAPVPADAAAETADRSGTGSDYSRTNNQVAGVDEADIIKTDGRYLYLVANGRLCVVDAADPAAMQVVFSEKFNTALESEDSVTSEIPAELYLDVEHSRLVLIISGSISQKYKPEEIQPEDPKPPETVPKKTTSAETVPEEADPDRTASEPAGSDAARSDADETTSEKTVAADQIWYPSVYNTRSYTTTRVYDISRPENPVVLRRFSQDGSYQTSRMIGTAVYVMTNRYEYRLYDVAVGEMEPEEILPSTCETPGTDDWEALPPDRITILPAGDIGNQTILAAIDTRDSGREPDVLSILGSSGQVYASARYLYVAAWHYAWDGKETSTPVYSTELYRFSLDSVQISEAGKGSVPGSIINQFSMDEYDGYFRIATTTGDTWSGSENPLKNNLYILDGSLNIVGEVTGLAPGESIKSVRFMGPQAFVVTFRTIDPLFVIDLENPRSARVLGELKIPGYSTYLHPYSENLLLGFGYDVMTEGERAYNLGLKVSLFNISHFNDPREVSTVLLGGSGSHAEVLYNHKSLLFSREKNIIAFPATLANPGSNDPRIYTGPSYQGLIVLGLDDSRQLFIRGSVTHFDKADPSGPSTELIEKDYQAFYGYDAIYRSVYIGDILYTFSARQVRSARLDDCSAVGQVELPGFDEIMQYWYYPEIDVVR